MAHPLKLQPPPRAAREHSLAHEEESAVRPRPRLGQGSVADRNRELRESLQRAEALLQTLRAGSPERRLLELGCLRQDVVLLRRLLRELD